MIYWHLSAFFNVKWGFYLKLRDRAHISLPKYNRPEDSIKVPQRVYKDSLSSKFWLNYREFSLHSYKLPHTYI